MGLPLMILRFVATPILGIAIFFGLLLTLVESNITNKLLDAEFYTDTIAEHNTYTRIYDDVLLDQKAKDKMQELLGDVKVVSPEDVVGLVRGCCPLNICNPKWKGRFKTRSPTSMKIQKHWTSIWRWGPPWLNSSPHCLPT